MKTISMPVPELRSNGTGWILWQPRRKRSIRNGSPSSTPKTGSARTARCEPVIGGVITYFDTAHITATYAETLAPQFGARLSRTGLDTFE